MVTVIVALAVCPVTDAVMLSDPVPQPLSLYVEVAVPVLTLLGTGEVSVALPKPTQSEVKATWIGIVAAEPPIRTGMLTLLVP
jgi:hypothetical protein